MMKMQSQDDDFGGGEEKQANGSSKSLPSPPACYQSKYYFLQEAKFSSSVAPYHTAIHDPIPLIDLKLS